MGTEENAIWISFMLPEAGREAWNRFHPSTFTVSMALLTPWSLISSLQNCETSYSVCGTSLWQASETNVVELWSLNELTHAGTWSSAWHSKCSVCYCDFHNFVIINCHHWITIQLKGKWNLILPSLLLQALQYLIQLNFAGLHLESIFLLFS